MSRTTTWAGALLLAVLVAGGCAHQPPLLTTTRAASSGPATSTPSATTSVPTAIPVAPAASADRPAPATPYPHGRAGIPAGGLPGPSTRTRPNPDVVVRATLTVLYGSDTTLDNEPLDAEKRALPWLGGRLAEAARTATVVAAPGAAWNVWAAHHAHLRVSITRGWDDGAPPDTPTGVSRQYVVTQTPVGDAGWTGPLVRTVVAVSLTRTAGRWQVTGLLEED